MELHHVRRGAGEPLLLIQGMSGNHVHWGEPFLAELERDFDVVAFDNRGMGRSPRVDEPFTIAQLADDAAGVMDAVGFESAHVLGISMGGMIAQELVLNHGARVRTLTLGCTYCGGPGSSLAGPEVAATLGEALMSGDRARAFRTGYELNVSSAYAAQEGNYEPWLAAAEQLPAPLPVTMLQMQAISGHDTSARLASVDVPTLVVHGDEDRMIPVANAALIAALIPGAKVEVLEGVGHMFWWEQPQRAAPPIAPPPPRKTT
jgi:3-oxoadipate enol-lactonase